jgi:outer membrane protein OmpA-like peptidoglycan-associated protein
MRVIHVALLGALTVGGVASASAQSAGTVEIGGFGRYSKFDKNLHFDNRVGVGARLGVFVLRNLAIEADGSYTPTYSQGNTLVRAEPLHGRLIYNAPLGSHAAFLIGAGYTRQLFRKGYRETRSGAGGLLGLRLGTGGVLSIRLDATGDYIPTAESNLVPPQLAGITQHKSNLHWGGQAGLSLLLGQKHDGDRDKDGVKDSADQCPNTPLGERVDATGCPLPKDADGDGVADNLDRCPNTPAGTAVDATGCPKDSDGDGVIDAQDKCPNTPAGTPVDATGCPKDSDGDGVIDAQDKCPNTPAGTAVDATGCPKDSDHDGVIDAQDKCPNTPAGTAVDATGCPKDSDGDGVADAADKCPNTPAGAKVDAVGCPALFAEPGKALVLQGVNFETAKATLKPESQAILDKVAESLNNNPEVNVEVGGHTDNRGTRAANLRLSQARAFAVRQYLIEKGVAASRITAQGYGPDKPVADNTTATGRAANRRVELSRTN